MKKFSEEIVTVGMYGPRKWQSELLEPYNFLKREKKVCRFLACWRYIGWRSKKSFYILIFFSIGLIKFVLVQRFTLHKPIGHMGSGRKDWFTGKFSAYDRPLEVAKKSHMVEPTGDTELGGRWRRVEA